MTEKKFKLSELRRLCAEKLESGGIERPFYVTDIIISKVLGIERSMLITRDNDEIPPCSCEGILSMVGKRLRRVPLSYIVGESEFYGRVFKVGEGCLIPRPETELLVEEILNICPAPARFADWCTGSGCIGITLLLENKGYTGIGVDSSMEALKWAEANSRLYSLEGRFELFHNSVPSELDIETESLDFIVSNPPYIPSVNIGKLMPDVKDYEPREALDGGELGLDIYRMLFSSLPRMLKCGGILGFETAGNEQAGILAHIAPEEFVLKNKIFDYNGILRHLIWIKQCK
jgi:release factor glutamine methyltransferase